MPGRERTLLALTPLNTLNIPFNDIWIAYGFATGLFDVIPIPSGLNEAQLVQCCCAWRFAYAYE